MRFTTILGSLAVCSWVIGDLAHQPGRGILGAAGLAVLACVALWFETRAHFRRRTRNVHLATAADVLHVKPDELRVRRARWNRAPGNRRADLASMRVRCPDGTNLVRSAVRDELTARLSGTFAAPVTVTCYPAAHEFVVSRAAPADASMLRYSQAVTAAGGTDWQIRRLAVDGDDVLSWSASWGASVTPSASVRSALSPTVNAKTGVEWVADWQDHNDRVVFTRTAPLPAYAPHPVGADVPDDALPFAETEHGRVVYWLLSGSCPHALVCGPTGAGKSSVMRSLAAEAILRGYIVWLLDPKRVSILGLASWGAHRTASTAAETGRALADLRSVIEDRYRQLESKRVRRSQLPRVVCVFDEAAQGLDELAEAHAAAGGKGEPQPVADLRYIIRMGRECRVHVCLGMQHPAAVVFGKTGTEMRGQLGLKVGLGAYNDEVSRMLGGIKPRGDGVRGRGVAVSDDHPHTIQAWYTPDPEDDDMTPAERAIVDALRPAIPMPPAPAPVVPAAPAGDETPQEATTPRNPLPPAVTPPQAPASGRPALTLLQGGAATPSTDPVQASRNAHPGSGAAVSPPPPQWLTRQQVAAALGVSLQRVSQLKAQGRLGAPRPAPGSTTGALLFDPAAVDAILASRV